MVEKPLKCINVSRRNHIVHQLDNQQASCYHKGITNRQVHKIIQGNSHFWTSITSESERGIEHDLTKSLMYDMLTYMSIARESSTVWTRLFSILNSNRVWVNHPCIKSILYQMFRHLKVGGMLWYIPLSPLGRDKPPFLSAYNARKWRVVDKG